MALQSDSLGFLIGEPIDIGRMPTDISRIRDDVSAIRQAIAGRWREHRRPAPSAVPARDSAGRFVSASQAKVAVAEPGRSKSSGAIAEAIGISTAAERIKRSSSQPVALPGRDSAGRFTSDGGPSGNRSVTASGIASIGDRLSRLTAAASGIDDADPAVKAAREVAEPLRRGFEFFRGDKQTSLLKKIFAKLAIFQKEESVYNKATKETLEKIERKPVTVGAQSGGGIMSALGGISVIGTVARAIGKIAAGGGMFGALANGGRGALGLLKRIPILGTLLAAGGAAFDIFGSESDSSLSRRDKDKAAGTSVGGWVGSIGGVGAGALAGSMLGPVGTIVGGFLGDQAGQIIGDKFGGWVSDLREADIPGKIAGAWDGAVSTMSTAFSESWAKVKDIGGLVTQVIGEQIGGLADYIKANTGIDLKQQGAARLDRTKANAGGAWDFAKKAAASLVDKTMQSVDWMGKNTTVGKAIGKAASAFQGGSIHGMSPAQFAALAADTRRTESGGNTSAENKYGYIGAYQFGAAALADTGLVDAAKLKAAQKSGRFNQKTFLADPANWLMAGGKDAFLADQALQDQTYSKYSEQLQKAGLRSGVLSAGSTPEQIAAYVKAAHLVGAGGANKFFTRGIDSADANGTLASKYAKQGAMAVASVSTPQIGPMPKIPTIPAIAEAPKVIEPLGSPAAPAFTVNLPPQDVGQNLSDRRIAQIASGGIG